MRTHRTRDRILVEGFTTYDPRTLVVERTCEVCGVRQNINGGTLHQGRLLKCAACRKPASVDALRTELFR